MIFPVLLSQFFLFKRQFVVFPSGDYVFLDENGEEVEAKDRIFEQKFKHSHIHSSVMYIHIFKLLYTITQQTVLFRYTYMYMYSINQYMYLFLSKPCF